MNNKRTEWITWLALFFSISAFLGMVALATPAVWSATTQQNSISAGIAQPSNAEAIAQSFNYQGILRTANGSLLTGSYTMTLRLYDGEAADTPLFTQTATNISVRDGIFNVVLSNLPSTTFATSPRYLGITIGSDIEMSPRQEIHAVPWALVASSALVADTAKGLQAGAYVSGDMNVMGGIGIGTTNPASELDVFGQISLNGQRVLRGNSDIISVGDLIGADGYQSLELRAGDDTRIYVTRSGDVGIGTTDPKAKLDVKGGVQVNGLPLVRILRFENIGNGATIDTGVSADEYHCVASGWSALYEVDAVGAEVDALWTYVSGNTWRFRNNFASGADSENPDVDIICFRQEIASWEGAARTLNSPD